MKRSAEATPSVTANAVPPPPQGGRLLCSYLGCVLGSPLAGELSSVSETEGVSAAPVTPSVSPAAIHLPRKGGGLQGRENGPLV